MLSCLLTDCFPEGQSFAALKQTDLIQHIVFLHYLFTQTQTYTLKPQAEAPHGIEKGLIIRRKCMATRRESTLHNNHRGDDGKRLNTVSFVLHIKGTIPDRSKQCQKHLMFDLCWADMLLVWGRFQDDRAKIPWFYFLYFTLYCFYNLASII